VLTQWSWVNPVMTIPRGSSWVYPSQVTSSPKDSYPYDSMNAFCNHYQINTLLYLRGITSKEEKHGNSGGTGGGKDTKRPYAGRDTAPAPQPSSSRDTPNRQGGRSRLPPAPWVDQPTSENRKDRGLCTRCGEKYLTFKCTKYSRSHRSPQTNDDRQNRDKRLRVTDTEQAKN
jgi:hypothetical protein